MDDPSDDNLKQGRSDPAEDVPEVRDHATISFDAGSTNSGGVFSSKLRLPEHFGRYHIVKELGHGGMGTVYLAFDKVLERQVALKIPLFSAGQDEAVADRFMQEARAAASIHHAGICPIYDVGQIDGIRFISMAYIEGKPLANFVKRRRPQPEKSVANAIRKLAIGLEVAHKSGVVHRDLKPNNIMVTGTGDLIVMDFGLARRNLLDTKHPQLTQSGILLGTPAYMSPEQVLGDAKSLGPASDIFSLGVVMYQLLTGALPFQGNVGELLVRIATETPVPPTQLRSGLNPKLSAICEKAMAKRTEDRFPSMAEFAMALTNYLNELSKEKPLEAPNSESVEPQAVGSAPQLVEDLLTPQSLPKVADRRGHSMDRTRRIALLSGSLIAAVAVAFVAIKFSGQPQQTTSLEPSPAASAPEEKTIPTNAKPSAPDKPKAGLPAEAKEGGDSTSSATAGNQTNKAQSSNGTVAQRASDPPGSSGVKKTAEVPGTTTPGDKPMPSKEGPTKGAHQEPITKGTEKKTEVPKPPTIVPDPQKVSKMPVPANDAQEKGKADVQRAFADKIANANTSALKRSLVSAMLAKAKSVDAQDTSGYALARAAQEVALKAGDLDGALEAVSFLADRYELDKYVEKANAIKTVASTTKDNVAARKVSGTALDVCRKAIADHQLKSADVLVDTALELQKRLQDPDLRSAATLLRKRVTDLQKLESAYDQALEDIKRDANDANANLTVGKVLCFSRGEWKTGLESLAKGSDKQLREVAESDLAAQTGTVKGDAEPAIRAGDGWWTLCDKPPEEHYRECYLERARYWYRRALPTTNPLHATHIQNRLESITAMLLPPLHVGTAMKGRAGDTAAKRIFAAANGQKSDSFAFATSMPIDAFANVRKLMSNIGFYPICVSPYGEGRQQLIASIWMKGVKKWDIQSGSLVEMKSKSEALYRDGGVPVHASGTVDHLFVVWWQREKDDTSEIRWELGESDDWEARKSEGYGLVSSHEYRGNDGTKLRRRIWRKPQGNCGAYFGNRSLIESMVTAHEGDGKKLSGVSFLLPTKGGEEPSYNAVWLTTAGTTVCTFGLPIDRHTAQCNSLASDGYRPKSIDAKFDSAGNIIAASVWEKVHNGN